MVAKIKTFSFLGIDVAEITVQVKISHGTAKFSIVGLPDKAVGESKERVHAAITSMGLAWPYKRITVNLSPADLQKEGSHFDLPIALGILIEMGIINQKLIDNFFVLGELFLDGSINSVSGIISAAIAANERHCGIICPKDNGKEAAWAGDLEILAPADLLSLLNHLKGEQFLSRPKNQKLLPQAIYPDLCDIKGQESAKRALEIAAAGGHNILLIGPPGTGKSMLASRLPGLLPEPDLPEILQINMIHSVSGQIIDGTLMSNRPYRDPHHSCSMPAMVGGGSKVKPGEISLAHHGILFLDELAEFPRQVLDSLRQPLETGSVSISRANSHITFPANFQLVAAMNPCRCGYLGDARKECKSAPDCGKQYQNKISGPMLDRMDIMIDVPQVDIFTQHGKKGESSHIVAKRVQQARDLQKQRYENDGLKIKLNARIDGKTLEKYTELDQECQKILKQSVERMSTSMRGITRILRVCRTIADLEESPKIQQHHLLEAISYRRNI